MKRTKKSSVLKVTIPLEGDEKRRFAIYLQLRGAKVGPFLRQLILTVMDQRVGRDVENAIINREIPF